jgi:ABC-type nitrate/sulfonate/bicarbonate transport system permease component
MAAFLLFASGLWRVLRNAETERSGASSLVLVGAAILAVGAALFAGVTVTLSDFADDLQPQAMQALNALNQDLFPPLALGVFTFLIGAGASIVATAALPKWVGWVAVVLAIAALTPVGFFAFLALGLWILIVSALLFRRRATPAPARL